MAKSIIILACMSLLAGVPCSADIIYVKQGGTGGGTSWTDAYGDLQDGLDDTDPCDVIWVAEGTYYPTSDYGLGIGDRGKHFRMKNGVAIYGGFPNTGDPNMADRDPSDPNVYPTVLSGDIGVPSDNSDNCFSVFCHPSGTNLDFTAILDGFTITKGSAFDPGGHSYGDSDPNSHGAGMYNYESNPTLANCTFIRNSAKYGGGMYNYSSSPTVTNCAFKENKAEGLGGGGMYNWDNSSPKVMNCTFKYNWASWDGGGMSNGNYSSPIVTNCTFSGNSAGGMVNKGYQTGQGGGMFNGYRSSPIVTNCRFTGNSAYYGGGMINIRNKPIIANCRFIGNSANCLGGDGGGMYNHWDSDPTIANCIFIDNSARDGGGMFNYEASPILTNCVFIGNSAYSDGGGIHNERRSNATVTGCVFAGNLASNGNAIACYSYPYLPPSPSTLHVTNSILWDGGDEIFNNDGSTITITYSDIQDGWAGGGNIDTDPLFADPDGPDDVAGTEDDNLRLLAGSPCLDAGDSNSVGPDLADLDGDGDQNEPIPWDLDGHNRFVDDPCTADTGVGTPPIVDMGAYERGICGDPDHPYLEVDINNDCEVDITDAVILALAWLSEDGGIGWNPACNLYEADSVIDASDFAVMGQHWLECTKPECD